MKRQLSFLVFMALLLTIFMISLAGAGDMDLYPDVAKEFTSFYDEFSGYLSKWPTINVRDIATPYGDPQPRLLQNVHERSGIFDNNGDSMYPSGAISNALITCEDGCTIESEVYLDFYNLSGCWAAPSIGMTKTAYPDGQGYSDRVSEYGDGVYLAISADGDACWGTPAEYRRHAYFWAGIYAEDGTSVELPYWSINADQYANGWHVLKIVINADRTVMFYADNNMIWQPAKKIHPSVLEGRNIVLGARSSSSAGKAYHDWIRVYH